MPKYNPQRVSLSQVLTLWAAYTDWQRGQLAPSTIDRDYKKLGARLAKIPKTLKTSASISQWMRKPSPQGGGYSAETTRRTLQQLNACYAWAMGERMVDRNPWDTLPRMRPTRSENRYRAFTPADKYRIIQEFRAIHPNLVNWVRFLFLVGCRPSEAAALAWGKVAPDCSTIRIDAARPSGTTKIQGTKRHHARQFGLNPETQSLLQTLRPQNPDPAALVFTGVKGGPFNHTGFQRDVWKPLVTRLYQNGEITVYLPQKNCRHTRGTELARAGLTPSDASALLGNTPAVYLSSYVEQARVLKMPD